jgi:tRNA (5-methylaminomethyl-2-thiouridylate)-methyltransferase
MKIAVLVSGGVDSSVALKLLKDQGHELTAFYLKIWLEDELAYLGDCPWEVDLEYVRAVCNQLNIPLQVISLQKEYRDYVVYYTLAEVKAGRTPNPDILCNRRIKFGAFYDKIDARYDKVATGHYAKVVEKNGTYELHVAPDAIKDQTYFLSQLSQEQLKRALFPIGHLSKAEVRALAHKWKLPTSDRKDSQGICFLGKISFKEFLAHHLGYQEGKLIEYETGAIVGTHQGYWFYTIGQRQGLGLAGGPWYVVSKDSTKNIVYISCDYYANDKVRNSFSVIDCNWISMPTKTNLMVKLRHGKHMNPCTIILLDDGSADVQLSDRDQGIASGQCAVFYDGDQCLGGGIIECLPVFG